MASSSSALPPADTADVPAAVEELNIPNVNIEAESLEPSSDSDSAYGDDLESYTTSLKSSVLNYRYENGRRYHGFKDKAYFLPNDDAESDRLDMYHHIMVMRCDGLHTAPIDPNPQRILDIGTGTGIWAIDMGDKYPSAEILGNDLSPIQPSLVPPNVKFEVDDVENEWIYSSKFDFIHCRYMAGSLKDWPRLMQQAFKFTKPGGWVEFRDFDMVLYTSSNGDFKKGEPLDDWITKLAEGLNKFGMEPHPGPKLYDWVKDAGFVNIGTNTLPIPTGTWPKDKTLKEIGAFDLVQFLDNVEGMTLRVFTNVYGWSADEIQVFCAKLRKDMKNQKKRIQHNLYVVYAQKPLDAE